MADTNPLIPASAPVTVVNNPPAQGDSALGLTGFVKTFAQAGIIGIFMGVFLWLFQITVRDGRTDRMEDRTIFRDAVERIQREDDRRAGEVKGAMDTSTSAMRELIMEIRAARNAGLIRSTAEPKAIPPEEEK